MGRTRSTRTAFVYWITALVWGLLGSTSAMAEDYALLINGGGHPSVNYARYYRNLKKVHGALLERGVARDHITTLYADGTASDRNTVEDGVFFKTKPRGISNSFLGDGKTDITGPASKEEVLRQLSDLAKKLKPGDHLFFFVTDHGSGKDGAALSDGKFFNEKELAEALSHFPKGVKIHGLTTFCWGGRYVLATSPDACFFSNTDTDHLAYANAGNDPFLDSFLEGWGNSKNRKTLLAAAEYAKAEDSLNPFHTNSLDHFRNSHANTIAQRKAKSETCASCLEGRIGTGSEITSQIQKVLSLTVPEEDPVRELQTKGLNDRLKLLEKELNSEEHTALEKALASLENDKRILNENWARLPESTQNSERPGYTRQVEKLNQKIADKTAQILELRGRHARTLWELDFVQYATKEELAQYTELRKCVEYTF